MNFSQLLKKIDLNESFETKSTRAIKTGLNIRDDFWEDFLRLCSNVTALAELLDVSEEKINSWFETIKSNLEKVKKANKSEKVKTKLINTGRGK